MANGLLAAWRVATSVRGADRAYMESANVASSNNGSDAASLGNELKCAVATAEDII